nr:reverse transcriptase domain-containing protein [Tanacetum cinerariifolium]
MRTQSAGWPIAESQGRGTGGRVGRGGGKGSGPREAQVGNQGNVENQNGNVVTENVQENVGNVLVNGNRVRNKREKDKIGTKPDKKEKPPTVGYEDAVFMPEIAATNFELKHGLINLVQNKQFFGHDKEDPHAHIRYFNKITSTMRVPNIPNSMIKLMLFPFSLEGAAWIWLEKEPPRSILTWDDLVSKFINHFFPPSKTTNLHNEITRFQQRFDESFSEAWDRFNDLLRACPHHGFSELHQLDTFYNSLNINDQDSLNSAAGGNFLDKMPFDCLKIIESKSKVRQSRAKAAVAKSSALATSPTPAPIKAVESNCVTCGVLRNIQSQGQSMQNQCQNIQNQYQTMQNKLANLTDMMSKFMRSNMASSLGSGTLPGNTVTNPKEDLKGITTRSGVVYNGPTIPTPSKVVKQDRSVSKPIGIAKDVSVKTGRALIDMHKGELTLRIGNEAMTYNLDQTSRYSSNYDQMTANKIDVTDEACEEYFQEVLGFSNVTASGSPTPSDDPTVSITSLTLTPFGDSDFLLFEEANAFHSLEDDPDSLELDHSYYDLEGDIQMLEAILNSDPTPSLLNHEQSVPSFTNELKACEAKTIKSSVHEPPEVELKDLPPHLEYAFLEGDNKFPVIISKDLGDEEKAALIKVLKSHKRAITWKLSDIQDDKALSLLLVHPFLRTCGAVIDMGHITISIDDGVIHHTYFPKPRAKAYLESFEIDEEDDCLSCFEVGHYKDGNPKYGHVAPSFLDIKDEMERALAIEAYSILLKI